ncbi:MAG TPA: hypothetical protein VD973_01585 [Symbiobacteriaceae bacterium]|nr:hypothetical protein [Symbiobacteriaceae bacterium]
MLVRPGAGRGENAGLPAVRNVAKVVRNVARAARSVARAARSVAQAARSVAQAARRAPLKGPLRPGPGARAGAQGPTQLNPWWLSGCTR